MVKTKPTGMRILFFIDSLKAGGKERRLTELMKALSNRTDISFMLVLMDKEIHYKQVLNLTIRIEYLVRKTKKDLSVFKKFYGICKDYKPDIVHCWNSMTAIYSVPACKFLKIKLVNGIVVDTPVQQNIFNISWLRAKLTFPFSDVIIGNSKAGLAAYKAPQKRSTCIYNGVDLTRFQNLKSPALVRQEIFKDTLSDLFIVGMVAAFENRKDYKTLVTAAKILIACNNNIRFILIGDGSNFLEIKNDVPELLNKIVFLGNITNIESIINIFDVGILLTNSNVHGEGISNSIIEYMALSKPVIATEGGGTNEIVFNNENGYLIENCNIHQLIQKIELLIKNPSKIKQFGEKGNEVIHKKFDIKLMTNNYLSVYNNVVKKQKG
jgi:glycosyltransferase involved in cell wall biosynthesis